MMVFSRLVWIIISLVSLSSIVSATKNNDSSSKLTLLSQDQLFELSTILRQGDDRLVRPGLLDDVAYRQEEHQNNKCPSIIPSLVYTLNYYHTPKKSTTTTTTTTNSIRIRGQVAEVLHLCTTNNPTNRHQIAMIGTKKEDSNSNNNKHDNGTGKDDTLDPSSTTVHEGLLHLIQDAQDEYLDVVQSSLEQKFVAMNAIGTAAEAIWILSFNHPIHHERFVNTTTTTTTRSTIDILTDIILMCKPPTVVDLENANEETQSHHHDVVIHVSHDCVPRTVMWCLAALQNLAASYCHTESGYCHWEWSEKEERLVLTTPLKIDGEFVRSTLLSNSELMDEILELISIGPVDYPHGYNFEDLDSHETDDDDFGDDTPAYAWPSRSIIAKVIQTTTTINDDNHKDVEDSTIRILDFEHYGDELSESIIPWAATGLLKNLALSFDQAQSVFLQHDDTRYETTLYSLCHMYHSPDWLEQLKADQAMYHLGIHYYDSCPPLYNHDTCRNLNWIEKEYGESCEEYEENNWCVEFGHMVDENGVSANEACCACGGGNLVEEFDTGEL